MSKTMRRAAEEGEGRGQHAPIADGHQMLDAALAGLHQQVDRVGPVGGGLETGMASRGQTTRSALPDSLRSARVRRCAGLSR
jgi:hypothetical protein